MVGLARPTDMVRLAVSHLEGYAIYLVVPVGASRW